MRSQLTIRKKLRELEKDSQKTMAKHLEVQKADSDNESYLRIYNKICERIWALKWALGESEEI
jgi:hypothetical protein